MSNTRQLTTFRTIMIAGLIISALGISLLWVSGVKFPVYPPPGIVILLAGALFVALVSKPWSAIVGMLLSLFIIVGFLVSPEGRSNLVGNAGVIVAIGQGIQLVGVVIALIASSFAAWTSYRKEK